MTKTINTDKRFFYRIDAHYRLMLALAVSAIVFFCFHNNVKTPALILFFWIGCALTVIVLDWIIIFSSHPREVRKIARLQDSSRTFLFLFITTAAVASLGQILFFL